MAVFNCESCGYERAVPDTLLGKKAKCPDCGRGVVITDAVVEQEHDSHSFDAEVSSDGEQGLVGVQESVGVDLDNMDDSLELDIPDDIICDSCGYVLDHGQMEECPQCGNPLVSVEDGPYVTENDIDVSDLADGRDAEVWDTEPPSTAEGYDDSVIDSVEDERPSRFFAGSFPLNVFGGVVSGLLAFFFAISLALLVTSPENLHHLLPYLLAMSVTSMIVGGLFYSLQSRIPFGLAGSELVLTAVIFLFASHLYGQMEGKYPVETITVTILAAIALSSVVVGCATWLMGRLRVGEYVRFIPMQIIGGVLGAIGVFIALSALSWMGGFPIQWDCAWDAIQRYDFVTCLYSMGPPVVFALILFFAVDKCRNALFILVLLLGACAVAFGAEIWGTSTPIKSLAAPLSFLDNGAALHPMLVLKSGYIHIAWDVLRQSGMYMGAMIVLVILTSMYHITCLELLSNRTVSLDQEYRALGFTGLVSGLCGGMPVSVSYNRSLAHYASGGRGPVAGVVTALVCALGLYFADVIFLYIPRFVPEGVLLFVGLDLMRTWLFKTRSEFTRKDDKWMLWIAFYATLAFGVIVGVGFGAGLALMVTVGRYSRDGAILNTLSGTNHRSNVDRAPAQQRVLKEFGDSIHILRLQGFLFLGSLEGILEELRERLDDPNKLPVEYLVWDFHRVTGLASAANIAFQKLDLLVQEYGFELIITSAPLELEEHLQKCGYLGEHEGAFKVFFNLDYALEWCENHVLETENMLVMKQMTLPELLEPVFPEPKYIPALMKVLKRMDVPKGEAVFRQGDSSDAMYFVESGRLDVELEGDDGKLLRLKKVGPGAVFGEMGIYTFACRSATVRAAESCVLYQITKEKLDAIEQRAPVLVTSVNRYLVNLLSERLADANFKVRDLMM